LQIPGKWLLQNSASGNAPHEKITRIHTSIYMRQVNVLALNCITVISRSTHTETLRHVFIVNPETRSHCLTGCFVHTFV
jgi:hypothetical protein